MSAKGDASFAPVCPEAASMVVDIAELKPGLGNQSREVRMFRRRVLGGGAFQACRGDRRASAASLLLTALDADFEDPKLSDMAQSMGSQWPWLLFRSTWPSLTLLHQLQAWDETTHLYRVTAFRVKIKVGI